MSGEEYINAPPLIHKTVNRYHFLLRFIDSPPTLYVHFIGHSAIPPLPRFVYHRGHYIRFPDRGAR